VTYLNDEGYGIDIKSVIDLQIAMLQQLFSPGLLCFPVIQVNFEENRKFRWNRSLYGESLQAR
jgi:hypothetical protein